MNLVREAARWGRPAPLSWGELAKGMAQSVTRRGALKKFGLVLVGMALAALFVGRAQAAGRKVAQTPVFRFAGAQRGLQGPQREGSLLT